MAILKRSCCCCGCDVKAGSIVVAVIWIILSLIGLGYNATSSTPAGKALLAVYVVSLGTHILLIIAVVKAIRPLLLAWVIVTIICTMAALAIYIYMTDVEVAIINRLAAIGFFGWNVSKTDLTLIWIYWGALLIMTVYGCLVVFSHYQNLREAARGQGQRQMVVMGNQAYMAGNQAYMAGAGNQAYMAGNDGYMAGNQPYMAGNDGYMAGNKPYMAGNKAYMAGNQPYTVGKQPYMAGNQPYLVGNQPAKVANRPTASYGFL